VTRIYHLQEENDLVLLQGEALHEMIDVDLLLLEEEVPEETSNC
jgi:hypothetical protein